MKVLIIGNPQNLIDLPEGDYDEIIITSTGSIDWASLQTASIFLITTEEDAGQSELLDEVNRIELIDEPEKHAATFVDCEDLVFMEWNDSDSHHEILQTLIDNDVTVLDTTDEYSHLVIDTTPDVDALVKQITAKVTAEVLKIVRAEIAELTRGGRRFRSGTPKV